ncbi:MAG: hypothetical protein J5865_09000 [Lachnospiraceae bacterium]|nr:hypothetical protein [Lachnospiraceae bacterium]
MAKTKIGICDPNQDYAERFAWFVWHKLGDGCEASAYTKPQRLKTALAAGLDVLIMTESFFRKSEQPEFAARLRSVPTVVVLTDTEEKTIPGVKCIYRYRSAGRILEEVMAGHRLQEKTAAVGRSEKTRTIAVFSPVKRCGRTSLALALCEALGQVGSVLFLSFEVLSAHQGPAPSPTTSDLLYGTLIREDAGALLKQEDRGEQIWKLGAVAHAEDLYQVRPEDAERLMEALERAKLRRFLVADLGDLILPPASLLLRFDRVCMPVLQDEISQKKLALWQESLSQDEAAVLAGKTRQIDLSFLAGPGGDPKRQAEAVSELAILANRLMLEET